MFFKPDLSLHCCPPIGPTLCYFQLFRVNSVCRSDKVFSPEVMNTSLFAILILLISFGGVQPLYSQTNDGSNEQYRYRAARVENPPTVDGDLSEPAWDQAEIIDQFT